MKYKITFQENGKIKSKISPSIEDGKNIISIQPLESTPFEFNLLNNKKEDEIVFLFYEISMMLSSKLPIKDIIEILLKSHKQGFKKEVLETINKSLQDGQPIYKSLQKYEKKLGYLPILFFKLGEQNSNLTTALSSLYELLSENQNITNKIKKSLQYPLILLISFIISLVFIFIFVVPKFEYIFVEFGDKLPLSTTILLFVKNIFFEHYLFVFGIIVATFSLFYFLFQKYKYFFHKMIFFGVPYFSTMYRYLIFYKFFLSIALIVKSKHKFQDALYYAKDTTTNKFIQQEITLIIKDINDGVSISEVFRKRDFFDEIALRMITVGENTNNLEMILEDLKDINKKQLIKTIDDLSAFITPFFILIISFFVLWLVLAIMTPIWEMGNFIK
jgi:general secretion pathway protein F